MMKAVIAGILLFGGQVFFWIAFFKTQSWFGLDYTPRPNDLDSFGEFLHLITLIVGCFFGVIFIGDLLRKWGLLD